MLPAPAVTVIVPSYNYARYLPGALRGVLGQSMTDFELLLVEDGSTDQSPAVARSFAARDSRVRLLTHADGRITACPPPWLWRWQKQGAAGRPFWRPTTSGIPAVWNAAW